MLSLVEAGFSRPPTLAPFSACLRPGELLAIVGPNGAGKSTLLSLLSGFRRPEQGSLCLDGMPLHRWEPAALARRRALVAQALTLGFDWPVRELVALGSEASAAEIDAVLALLDLEALAERGALALSGGEAQRVMIARALCQLGLGRSERTEPGQVLLLDEPTSALDIGQQQRLMRLLRRLAQEHRLAIACVLHDLNLAARYAHRVWLLERGRRIAAGTPAEVLDGRTLARAFDAELTVGSRQDDGSPLVLLAP
ncbi:ATP-binding cassette domain-containing protein [Halomonas daqingensis]|mgnify:FL=1|uniref:ATP-binding cassette domain-containing protein n=1 Tax=Billgrantia desiderata TaxID=52021 RepID=A0ABS9B2M7_9GAMM|nr:ATP-binding cassette domain-containing protein [Halomonas desiderata]MCE8030666.1 ATP-binding cassette domain-containing protein [Halomonas desiderata]MCE8041356.1 ATP-binding cassette domain-containing protein [Halomonas desiderata]MCE8045931.1 ATP-binding cassette domain-containing protein [Halomonas desiderata]